MGEELEGRRDESREEVRERQLYVVSLTHNHIYDIVQNAYQSCPKFYNTKLSNGKLGGVLCSVGVRM